MMLRIKFDAFARRDVFHFGHSKTCYEFCPIRVKIRPAFCFRGFVSFATCLE